MGRLAEAVRSYILGPYLSGDKALAALFGGGPTLSGVTVNEHTALNLSAVWCAINVISGTVASLPLKLFRRLKNDGREPFTSHRLYKMVHDESNPEMTAFVFRQTLGAHALAWGNGYAEIERDIAGRPLALWPLTPDRVEPYRDLQTQRLRYRVVNLDGRQVILEPEDILHLPGLGFDGVRGYSVIYKARESLGLLSATERFGAMFFGNGAHAGGVAMHPGKLSETAKENIRKSIAAQASGIKAHGTVVLEEGMKWEKSSIPPDDAQFLETRKFQITEIARWFNIPPHKLKDLDRSTNNNIEHQGIEWVTDLRLWLVPWEQELNRKLISPLERTQQYFEHNVDGLQRGDFKSRMEGYVALRNAGLLTANRFARLENWEPFDPEEGDMLLVPLNMVPADRINDVIDAEIAAQQPPPPLPTLSPPPTGPQRDERLEAVVIAIEAIGVRLDELAPRPEPVKLEAVTATAKMIAAQRAIFVADLGRMVRKEANAARRAARRPPEEVRRWVGEFYDRHEDIFVAALLPAMQAHVSQVRGEKDPVEETKALAAAYVEQSRAELHRLIDGAPADLADAVDALVSRWEIERPMHLADAIMAEELAHALA